MKAPGVASVDRVRVDQAQIGGKVVSVTAVDPAAIGRGLTLTRIAGDPGALAPKRLLLSESAAKDRGLSVGASVPVQLARGGPQTFTLVGTYKANQLLGDQLLSLSAAKDFSSPADAALLIKKDAGTSSATALSNVEAAAKPYPTAQVFDQSGFATDTASQIDVVLSIVTVLLALSVLIAVLGIVNTLALAVIERTRELGLLRAVGLGRRQTRRMIRVEAIIVAVFGALLGIAVGSVLGVALQRALADQGISELRFPVSQLVLFLVVAVLAGILAALLPARRAARLDVLRAISTT